MRTDRPDDATLGMAVRLPAMPSANEATKGYSILPLSPQPR